MLSFWYTLLLVGLVGAKRPNILFIMTDDQDLHMTPPATFMPHVEQSIVKEGATFATHFCTVALCCPSRATLWTGRAAHNTNVTDVAPPYGGYPKVVAEGWNDNNLFLWMQSAGYNTYYTGKLWNAHTTQNYDSPYARGFNGSDFLLDPYTYQYDNAVMTRNGGRPVSYKGNYSTDVVAKKASGFLKEAMSHDEPWFLAVAPIAPHTTNRLDSLTNTNWFGPPLPAPRHADLFKNFTVKRDKSFNVPIEGAPAWPGRLSVLNDTIIAYQDEFQRLRLQSLQAVDEMVGALVKQLDDAGVLNNTYVFYTTDNGYHVSQHAMMPGKYCGYDTDIHIPLYVRGPGIEAGSVLNAVTTHTDLAPTILNIAEAPLDPHFDGQPIPFDEEKAKDFPVEHATIEYWGYAIGEGDYGWKNISGRNINVFLGNSYKSVRIVSKDYSLYYSVWCTNEAELYDLKTDPLQTKNLLGTNVTTETPFTIADRGIEQIVHRLDALTMVLKSCKGKVCKEPWHYLHPGGKVKTLTDALATTYDAFYANQPKVSYKLCLFGYNMKNEGPQVANVYDAGAMKTDTERETLERRDIDYGDSFHLWT
ncbi:uncharacterized protein Z518_09520 [Rhinocladiella mackenziei CBS 650.93]|uniref:Arylsulfatase n=1 Tax=Rhinocladiella mackenziei CBS 650.93 TaxID=1442369 RepID=A0A0D2GTW7_9EURO|nr:uncharacterized protein Z518_09520 [Rhinocladiella mackenziei CBS 650.93]KIX01793.1 hypothetical protein Z518_09520 [Rhinocladiella mackenziei CBS 650.93]